MHDQPLLLFFFFLKKLYICSLLDLALIRNAFQHPVDLLMFLEEQECRDGMGTKADEAGNPATEHPGDALLEVDIPQEPQNAVAMGLCWRGAHDAGLNHVDRAADRSRNESCHEGRSEVRVDVVGHSEPIHAQPFKAVICGELRGRHEHSAGRIRPHASEQAAGPLITGHLHQTMESIFIIPSFLRREGRIGLHSHVQDVGGIAHNATHKAGGAGHSD